MQSTQYLKDRTSSTVLCIIQSGAIHTYSRYQWIRLWNTQYIILSRIVIDGGICKSNFSHLDSKGVYFEEENCRKIEIFLSVVT
jgi:hypothetical protein